MNKRTPWTAILSLCCLLGGCAEEPTARLEKGPPVEPLLAYGKADVAERVIHKGRLEQGLAVESTLSVDLEFHAYTLEVPEASALTLEVTHKGSTRGLDTTLFLFGPEDRGSYGDSAIAIDDDSGYGALSKLSDLRLEAGRHLVVVGSADGTGRGRYRLLAECVEGSCPPVLIPEPVDDEILALLSDAAQGCVLHCDMKAAAFTFTPPTGPPEIGPIIDAAVSQLLDPALDWAPHGTLDAAALSEDLDRLGLGALVELSRIMAGDSAFITGWVLASSAPHPDFDAVHDAYILIFPGVGFGIAFELTEVFD